MTLRGDSYSGVADVLVWARHLIEGETTFNTTTRPTFTEVEEIIDEISGVLNVAYLNHGFTPANIKANTTAKQTADSWVRTWATSFVELSAPFQGLLGDDGDRSSLMRDIYEDAESFVDRHEVGYKILGIPVTVDSSEGVEFTAEDKQADRPDRTDTTLEKPLFERHKFDNT